MQEKRKLKDKKTVIEKKIDIVSMLIAISIISLIASKNKSSKVLSLFYNNIDYFQNKTKYEKLIKEEDISEKNEIVELYKKAIEGNNHIPDKNKDDLIKAFTPIIIKYSDEFSNETIVKLISSAKSYDFKLMESDDDFYEYTVAYNNSLEKKLVFKENELNSRKTLAHEQTHWIDFGHSALNEGFTSLVSNDNSYLDEQAVAITLCLTLGIEHTLNYFFNNDYNGLKKEMAKYVTSEEVDNLTFCLEENQKIQKKILSDTSKYSENKSKYIENTLMIKEILEKIYINKSNDKEKTSNLGQLIFNSYYFSSLTNSFLYKYKTNGYRLRLVDLDKLFIDYFYCNESCKKVPVFLNNTNNFDKAFFLKLKIDALKICRNNYIVNRDSYGRNRENSSHCVDKIINYTKNISNIKQELNDAKCELNYLSPKVKKKQK